MLGINTTTGAILETLNAKADSDLNNILSGIDYVIQSGQSEDDTMWYRKYKSGWLEQGGTNPIFINQQLIFPLPYANTDYTITALPVEMNPNIGSNDISYSAKSTTGIRFILRYNGAAQNGFTCMWHACGKGA